jgi:peptidoglycan/xylan/chitin deacetylase (PgdA/CDA1 family)
MHPPILVLLYHRVNRVPHDPVQLSVTPENFRAQMAYLHAHYPVLRWESDWAVVSQPSVIITFDDGYADNLTQALPILEEFQIPATFFICPSVIDNQQEFWWDELERLLFQAQDYPPEFNGSFQNRNFHVSTRTQTERATFNAHLQPYLKSLSPLNQQALLQQIRDWARQPKIRRESHRGMSRAELTQLAAHPLVTIGAHTMTHPVLSQLNRAEQEQEIIGSQKTLSTWLSRSIEHFSYPFGRQEDYNRDSVEICRTAGFKKVAANDLGTANALSSTLEIPRLIVRDWNEEKFAKILRLYRFL